MTKNIISLVLLIVSVVLNIKHGWDTFNFKSNPESVKAMENLGISESVIPFFGFLTFLVAILLLIPRTFFLGNLINAFAIIMIMTLALRSGNYKMALIEVPFLVIPLIMIWLKYPFKN